ncbi:polysaccharide deacetylase family protein [Thermodesulfitimonas sp.]
MSLLPDFGQEGLVLRRGPRGTGKVALTFDDGPDPFYTPQILALLRRYETKVTFFFLAQKVRRYPEVVQAVIRDGHHIASHGFAHRPQPLLSYQSTRCEMRLAAEILTNVTGESPRYFRPPWGLLNRWTLAVAQELGMQVVLWSCDSLDWLWGIKPSVVAKRVLRCPDLEGGIVLCHDGSFVPHRPRVLLTALPALLEAFKVRGWTAVPLPVLFT